MPLVPAKDTRATTNIQVARQLATEVRRSGMTAEQMRQRTGQPADVADACGALTLLNFAKKRAQPAYCMSPSGVLQ